MKSFSVFKESKNRELAPELIKRMESIVKTIIVNEKFRSDFYLHDLKVMQASNGGVFAWYVYNCGTHLIPLNNFEEVISFQKEWISNMGNVRDKFWNDRLYVCNTATGDLRVVLGFEDGNLVERIKSVV